MAEDGKPVAREEGEASPAKVEAANEETHPLETKWTFWFDNPEGKQHQAQWGKTLRPVYTFGTVEEFWGLYNNILPPSRLAVGADIHLFRDGIEPKWEDPACANGGKWSFLIPRGGSPSAAQLLDTNWLHVILACIGEQFDDGEEICGGVVNVRAKQYRIALWTRTAANEAVQVAIAKQLKEVLQMSDHAKIGFMAHSDAKQSNKPKDRYTV
ncbi:EIF4E [Auxenochlorella protothecoides x Auxenochlorella symbiontica]